MYTANIYTANYLSYKVSYWVLYAEKNVYCIRVNIYFKYIISLYIRKYIISSPPALNLIEYILNFSKCGILVKNIKLKQKFGLLTTLELA